MTDNPDLWEVQELPSGLALEMQAGDDPTLVLRSTPWPYTGRAATEGVAQGGDRVRVERAQVRSLADVARAFGLAIPAGQDSGSRWQRVVNARPEAGEREVAVIQRDGRPMAKNPAIDTGGPGAGLPSPSGCSMRGGRNKADGCSRADQTV